MDESEEGGGPQSRDQWSPLARARFADQSANRNVIASVGDVAMSFAISSFTAVRRAAPCAARVPVGAAVSSSQRGIWGVSDPLCHPPITVPGRSLRGSLTPEVCVAVVRRNRAQAVTSSSAPPVSRDTHVDFISTNTLDRFSPETAFI